MDYSTTITFEAPDHDAALAEVQAWGLPTGATVHALVAMSHVEGLPATVPASGALEVSTGDD